MTNQLEQIEKEQAYLRQEELAKKDQLIASLEAKLDKLASQNALELANQLAEKDKEVVSLTNQLDKLALEKDATFQSKLATIEKERDGIKNQLALQAKESELSLASVRSDYEAQLKAANEQVEFYKNFKAQQSTKAIGESLELYAETEFNKVRSYAFPNASFVKDNQLSSRGSKGDYIYREVDANGVEILSIMFEMKNEADTTKTKHKNSDFFKELDKDRREKDCEYAVLVSMLEADNDYYNTGIVDVSHEYQKMYVVRPQLFIQLIGILRNAALNSLHYKQELALVKEQNIDITHFEEDLDQFKNAFAKNYQSASNNFKKAIDEIDKSIKRMEEVKRFLTTSENQLRLANNKLEDVSVKKLTRQNPTMREKFEALKDQ
ncbi:serine/threonine-protein kinase MRCK beta [Streptococcus pyogenes]|nr:serine/threonine-protein kinase MRCK beta [Streptococcus pyogenes]